MANWERSINFVLRWEGGYVNNPNDPGGETKFGIAKRFHPDLDIKNITIEQAKEIYNIEYWEPLECYRMSDSLALVIFDSGVNCGVSKARKWFKENKADVNLILADRENHYRFLALKDQFKPFLKGWLNRLESLKKEIIHMTQEVTV